MRRLMMPSAGAVTSHAPAPPHQLAPLRFDLRLLGLGELQPVLRSRQLRLRGARGLLALVEHGFRHVAGAAQRLGPLDRRCGFPPGAPRPARSSPSAWAMAAAVRARPASFWASWASSVSATSRASTSPFFTRMPSSASTSVTRRPSTSGPTRISSRATSEPVASTVSVKSAGATRATVTTAATSVVRSLGGRVAVSGSRRRAAATCRPASARPSRRRRRARAPISNFLMVDPSRFAWVWLLWWRRAPGLSSSLDQLQHGRHHGLRLSKSGSTARRQNMPSRDHHERLGHRRDVERRARCGPSSFSFWNSFSKLSTMKRSNRWKISPTRGLRVDSRPISMHMRRLSAGSSQEIVLAQRLQRPEEVRWRRPGRRSARRTRRGRARTMPAISASLLSK